MNENGNQGVEDSFMLTPIFPKSHPLNPISGVENWTDRNTIKLLTYNIFLRPPLIKNNASDHKDNRLKEFVKLLGEFDIVCLQEMFGLLNKRKHKLIRCAAKSGFPYYSGSASPSFFSSFVVDGGLLVLSRFPIVASEFKPYPYGIFSDSLAQKGVLYTKIQIQEETLHIYCTHTQASYFGENQRYPILTRADQFSTFRQFMEMTLKKYGYKNGEVVLLMGDFNVDSRKPFIETNKIPHYPGFKEYGHLKIHEFFNEYEAMMCYLSNNFKDDIEDLLYKKYNEHPVTYADSDFDDDESNGQVLQPKEVVLTHKDDLCSNQSLDYIFKLIPKSLPQQNDNNDEDLEEGKGFKMKRRKLRVIEDSVQVERFFIKKQTFTQLSDHYGASIMLEYLRDSIPGKAGRRQSLRSSSSMKSPNNFESILNLD